jgi:biopolymer transport protein ExbD
MLCCLALSLACGGANFRSDDVVRVQVEQVPPVDEREDKALSVTVTKEDGVFLDGESVPFSEVEERLRAANSAGKVRCLIAADVDVPYDLVVEVLDMAKTAGFEEFTLGAAQ